MFWRRNKIEIEYLKSQLIRLQKKVTDLELTNIERIYGRNDECKFPKNEDVKFKLNRLDTRIASLEMPQKYIGKVMYNGKKHTVLSSYLETHAASEYYLPNAYERKYNLLFFEGDKVTQISDVPEIEISKP